MNLNLKHNLCKLLINGLFRVVALVLVIGVLFGSVCAKDVYLNLSSRANRRIFILVEDFKLDKEEDKDFVEEIANILRDDLRRSGIFRVEGKIPKFKTEKDYDKWVKATEDVVFRAVIKGKKSKKIKGELYDISTEKNILDRTWKIKNGDIRAAIHEIADDIIMYYTGKKGINNSKIIFSSDESGAKEIWMIDYDGENLAQLTNNKTINLLPRWYPQGNKFIYTTYVEGNPDLFSYDIDTKETKMLSGRQGLNSAGSFSPNGEYIALTINIKGDPEVCLLNNKGKFLKRITNVKGVDTSPTWSNDSLKVAYISERTGVTQLRYLDITNDKSFTLTYNNKYKDSPHWSPVLDQIVYAELDVVWNIFLVDVNTKEIKQLTVNSGNNESPCWSPDGKYICFVSNRDGKRDLYVMNADGSNQRKLADINGNIYSPRWR